MRACRLEGWATKTVLVPTLRDAVLRTAPQGEVFTKLFLYPLSLLAAASGERHGGLIGQDQEGEALFDVEPHALEVVLEVADREVLADRELEVAAALGKHQAAIESGRPDDVAVDQALDVAQDRVARVGAGGEVLVELLVQDHGEGAFDALVAQLGEGRRHRAGIVGMAAAERHRRRCRGLADAGDVRGLVAVEDRAVLGDGDLARRGDHRIEIGIARAAIDGVELGARHLERDAQLDQRLDAAQARLHVWSAGRRGDGIGAAEFDVGIVPAQRPAEVDHATAGQHAAEGALGFLLDLLPTGFGDRRAIAEKMVLHLPPSGLAAGFADRRLPMPRLPSLLGPPSSAVAPPSSMVASMPGIGPSVDRKGFRCCEKVGSLRRSHSSAIAACSFSSSRLCSRMARRSELPVALARWLYQSTASSSSISETMARCWSMTSGPSLPASSCSDSLDMRSPSIVRANTSPTGWSGKRCTKVGVPRLGTQPARRRNRARMAISRPTAKLAMPTATIAKGAAAPPVSIKASQAPPTISARRSAAKAKGQPTKPMPRQAK